MRNSRGNRLVPRRKVAPRILHTAFARSEVIPDIVVMHGDGKAVSEDVLGPPFPPLNVASISKLVSDGTAQAGNQTTTLGVTELG